MSEDLLECSRAWRRTGALLALLAPLLGAAGAKRRTGPLVPEGQL